MSDARELDALVERLESAEQAVACAEQDFLRYRSSVDSAGELALYERIERVREAVRDTIRELDDIVYPSERATADHADQPSGD